MWPLKQKRRVPPFLGEPNLEYQSAPFKQDVGNVGKRFHVVDDGGPAVQPHHRGEGRLDAGITAQALQGIQQRGFFAALIGACSRMRAKFEIEAGALNVFAQVPAA